MWQSEALFWLICNDVKTINLIKPRISMVRHSSPHFDYRKLINGIFIVSMAARQYHRMSQCLAFPSDQGKKRQVKLGNLKLQY